MTSAIPSEEMTIRSRSTLSAPHYEPSRSPSGPAFVLNQLATFAYLAYAQLPQITRNVPDSFVIASLGLWGLTAFLSINLRRIRVPTLVSMTVVWLITLSLYFFATTPAPASGNLFRSSLYYFPLLVFFLYRDTHPKVRFRVLLVACLFSTYTALSNIGILMQDPEANKRLSGSTLGAYPQYAETNLATIQGTNAAAIIAPLLLGIALRTRSRFLRLLSIVAFVAHLWFIALSGSTIAAIITLVSLISLAILSLEPRTRAVTLLIFGLTFLASEIALGTYRFLLLLSERVSNQFYAARLTEITSLMESDADGGSLLERYRAALLSIDTFLTHPIVGVGMVFDADYYSTGVGMHSQFLDDLARYGGIGLLLWGSIYLLFFRLLIDLASDTKMGHFVLSGFGVFVALSVLNPTQSQAVGVALFLIVPLTMRLRWQDGRHHVGGSRRYSE